MEVVERHTIIQSIIQSIPDHQRWTSG